MEIRDILEAYKSGEMTLDEAQEAAQSLNMEDLGFAKVDFAREKRVGCPEVIYCQGKAYSHIESIVRSMLERDVKNVMATRADREIYELIRSVDKTAVYHEDAQIAIINPAEQKPRCKGKVAVLTAGTADIRVAEEAAVTAENMGCEVLRIYDVGVAGLHRLLSRLELIRTARVIVCVAGMEGALASVVAGLVDKPVIAVPTSVGYGASFNGLSALLTMINSCAAGIGVVNIDNGFGAGYLAASINRLGD